MKMAELAARLFIFTSIINVDRVESDRILGRYNKKYLDQLVDTAIEYERYESLETLLVFLGVPEQLSLKEKIVCYQLLMKE